MANIDALSAPVRNVVPLPMEALAALSNRIAQG